MDRSNKVITTGKAKWLWYSKGGNIITRVMVFIINYCDSRRMCQFVIKGIKLSFEITKLQEINASLTTNSTRCILTPNLVLFYNKLSKISQMIALFYLSLESISSTTHFFSWTWTSLGTLQVDPSSTMVN